MSNDTFVTARDGVDLRVRVRAATGDAYAAVVVAHGFSATCAEPAVVAVADALGAAGYHVVSYDARGHGASGGRCTLGDHERLDVAAVLEVARARHARVVLLGASMGGIAVLGCAAATPDIAGVVTVSSPARWRFPRTARAALAALATQTGTGRWLMARAWNVRLAGRWTRPEPPASLVTRVQVPIAVVHGENDRFLGMREARDLCDAAAGPARLVLVPGMGHGYDDVGVPAVVDAVAWVLSAARGVRS